MCGLATVEGEVFWAVPDVDGAAVWLPGGPRPAWRTGLLEAGVKMHQAILLTLEQNGVDIGDLLEVDPATPGVDTGEVAVVHSTSVTAPGAGWASWHQEGSTFVHTYLAAGKPQEMDLNRWPDACPVTLEGLTAVGPPATHAAVAAPENLLQTDVLGHALRHLKHLAMTNATNTIALGPVWLDVLAPLEPALARMYDRPHEPAA